MPDPSSTRTAAVMECFPTRSVMAVTSEEALMCRGFPVSSPVAWSKLDTGAAQSFDLYCGEIWSVSRDGFGNRSSRLRRARTQQSHRNCGGISESMEAIGAPSDNPCSLLWSPDAAQELVGRGGFALFLRLRPSSPPSSTTNASESRPATQPSFRIHRDGLPDHRSETSIAA